MPSETFFCPRCKRQLTKSAQAYVLGEIMSSKKSGFIGIGERADTVTCPGCGASIDAQKMLAGEYDAAGGGALGCLGPVVGLATFAGIVFYLDFPWWAGLLAAFVTGGLTEALWTKSRAKRSS